MKDECSKESIHEFWAQCSSTLKMIDQFVELEQVMLKSCYIGKHNIVQTRFFEDIKCNEKCFTNVVMLNELDAFDTCILMQNQCC
jgi:hypothetical protein